MGREVGREGGAPTHQGLTSCPPQVKQHHDGGREGPPRCVTHPPLPARLCVPVLPTDGYGWLQSVDEFVDLMNNLGLPYPKKIDASLPANMACGFTD